MRRSAILPAAAGALVLWITPVAGQESTDTGASAPGNVQVDEAQGAEQPETPSDEATPAEEGSVPAEDGGAGEVEMEESAILPNAEEHEESEASTMDLDCEADPDNCLKPLTTDADGPALSAPDDVATPEVEGGETSAPVVAEPEG